jgi:hypothetical protein
VNFFYKIAIVIVIFIGFGVVGAALFISGNRAQLLPDSQLPIIESGVLYVDTDAITPVGGGGRVGNGQDYRIRLSAGKTVMVETTVDWLNLKVMLYDEGRLIGESSCGYNARCRFFAEMPKDGWGILRVNWGADGRHAPFSLEVRHVRSNFSLGKPYTRMEVLLFPPMPSIDLDVIYKGKMSASDVPLFKPGGGGIQEYKLRLEVGKPVLVQARSAGFKVLVSAYGEDGRIGFDPRRGRFNTSFACLQIEPPLDGIYTLRVTTPDNVRDTKAGEFTLEVFNIKSDEQSC